MNKNIFWFCDDPKAYNDYVKHLVDVFNANIVATANVEFIRKIRKTPFDLLIVNSEVRSDGIDLDNKYFQAPTFPKVNWLMRGIEFTLRVREGVYYKNGFKPDIPIIFIYSIIDLLTSEDQIHPLLKEYYLSKDNVSITQQKVTFQSYLTTKLALAAVFEIPFRLNLFTSAVAKAMSIEIEV